MLLKIVGWLTIPYVMIGVAVSKKSGSKAYGVIAGILSFFILIGIGGAMQDEQNTTTKIETKTTLAKAEAEAWRIEKYGTVPKSNAWDGVSNVIHISLKNTLNDPDSLKYNRVSQIIRTELKGVGCFKQTVDFCAKNGFGGYVRSQYVFFIRNEVIIDCWEL